VPGLNTGHCIYEAHTLPWATPSVPSPGNVLFHNLEAASPRSRYQQICMLLRPLSLACRRLPSVCNLSLYVCHISFSYKDTSYIELRFTLQTSFNLITSLKGTSISFSFFFFGSSTVGLGLAR
jgi:hypothetical protein